MRSLRLDIPEEVLEEAKLPPSARQSTLLRELAVQLYARELPKAAARRLSGMDRITFDELLGQRSLASRLSVEDFDTSWVSSPGASIPRPTPAPKEQCDPAWLGGEQHHRRCR